MAAAPSLYSNTVSKGSVLKEQVPFKVTSLTPPCSWTTDLPRYNEEHPILATHEVSHEFLCDDWSCLATQAVVMCLEIVLDENLEINFSSANTQTTTAWASEQEEQVVKQGWTLVQHELRWRKWMLLYKEVQEKFMVEYLVPTYFTQSVLKLSSEERCQAWQVLKSQGIVNEGDNNSHDDNLNALRLSQVLQDACPPSPYGILVDPPFSNKQEFLHSCVPNVALTVNMSPLTVQLIALYDLKAGEKMSASFVDASLPKKQRKAALLERFGPNFACDCIKCTGTPKTPTDAQRLGHAALQEGRYEQARQWYQRALDMLSDKKEDRQLFADTWHALGAISLQQGQFVKAQRVWHNAVQEHPSLAQHEGIALQLEKQVAYGYFNRVKRPISTLPAFTDYFSGLCFVTNEPAVSVSKCRQLIEWAEAHDDQWTTSRHYAVPTNDVPVHKVPPLLNWFVDWMDATVCPLLARQFGVSPDFYVHDAFVVRYEACQQHNHLPLHYDESTHSLVLALNDEYEGGGTYFYDHQTIISPSQGSLVSFRGDRLRHGGNVITKGARFILAVFLYHDCEKKRPPSLQGVLKSSKKSKNFSFDFSI